MISRRARLSAATVAVAASIVLAACTSAPSAEAERVASAPEVEATPEPTSKPEPTPTPEGPRPIVITTLLGESGVLAPLDGSALSGIVARVDELNDEGGVLGRPIELRRFDTSRVSTVVRTVELLVDDPPDLLVVGCDVDFFEPALLAAEENDWLTMSPCADDVGYRSGAWGPRSFTLGAPERDRGVVAAQAAFDLYGPTTMLLRDTTNPDALAFCRGFESEFVALGGSIVYEDDFTYDTLEPLIDRVTEGGGPSGSIAVCSHVPGGVDGAPSIIAQLRTLGFSAPIVAGTGVDQPGWFANVPQLRDLLYVSWSSIWGNDPDPWVNGITKAANENGETRGAGVATVLGAETIEAWMRAVEAADSVEHGRVAAALGAFSDVRLSTGRISFLGTDRMDTGRAYRVIRVLGDELTVLEVVATN